MVGTWRVPDRTEVCGKEDAGRGLERPCSGRDCEATKLREKTRFSKGFASARADATGRSPFVSFMLFVVRVLFLPYSVVKQSGMRTNQWG